MYIQEGGRKGRRQSAQNVPGGPGATPFTPINGGGPGKQDPRSPSFQPSIPNQSGNVYPGAPGGAPPMRGGGGGYPAPRPNSQGGKAPRGGNQIGGGGRMPQPSPWNGNPGGGARPQMDNFGGMGSGNGFYGSAPANSQSMKPNQGRSQSIGESAGNYRGNGHFSPGGPGTQGGGGAQRNTSRGGGGRRRR